MKVRGENPMNINSNGASTEAMLDRRHLLNENLEKINDATRQSGIADPVGFIVDARDVQGRQFVMAKCRSEGATEEEAGKRVDTEAASFFGVG